MIKVESPPLYSSYGKLPMLIILTVHNTLHCHCSWNVVKHDVSMNTEKVKTFSTFDRYFSTVCWACVKYNLSFHTPCIWIPKFCDIEQVLLLSNSIVTNCLDYEDHLFSLNHLHTSSAETFAVHVERNMETSQLHYLLSYESNNE